MATWTWTSRCVSGYWPRAATLGRRRNLSPGRNIPVRTFADWNRPPPGFLEIDLVAHCGDNMGGSFVYSLVATDVCTGWPDHEEPRPFPCWPESNP